MASKSDGGQEGFLFLIIVVIVAGYLFLKFNPQYIIGVWRWIKLIELAPFYYIAEYLPFYKDMEIQKAFHFLAERSGSEIAPITVERFDRRYIVWITWLPAVALIGWGLRRALTQDTMNKRYDMEQLLARAAPLYPHLQEYVSANPAKQPLVYKRKQKETHVSAMAISPYDFAIMSPPLGLEQQARRDASLRNPIWDKSDGFDIDLAERAFKAQLGRQYAGIESLKDYERRVFDALVSRLSVNQDDRMRMFKTICYVELGVKGAVRIELASFGAGYRELKRLFKDQLNTLKGRKKALDKRAFLSDTNIFKHLMDNEKLYEDAFKLIRAEEIMGAHAFVRVGLMELLDRARDSGVFASSELKWVKAYDRTLWFCLSTTGRKVSFTECAGCMAHWLLERTVGRAISHPEVTEAVQGLHRELCPERHL